MFGIDALLSNILPRIVKHRPVIVQQARQHNIVSLTKLAGEFRCLQRMLQFTDIFPTVAVTIVRKDGENLINR